MTLLTVVTPVGVGEGVWVGVNRVGAGGYKFVAAMMPMPIVGLLPFVFSLESYALMENYYQSEFGLLL